MICVIIGSSYPAWSCSAVLRVLRFHSAIFTDDGHYLNETNRLLSGTVILATLLF